MAKEYSNTEWIEHYLRGELHGDDLTQFEDKLSIDSELKEEFDLHFILVKAIQDAKKNELKSYLKENTKAKKRSLFEYNWVYSAAAAVVLLIASVSVYFIIQKPTSAISQKTSAGISANKNNNEPQFSAADKDEKNNSKTQDEFSVQTDSARTIASNETINQDADGVEDIYAENVPSSTNDDNRFKDSESELSGKKTEESQRIYIAYLAVEQESPSNSDEETRTTTVSGVRAKEVLNKKNKSSNENDVKSSPNKTATLDTISLNRKKVDALIKTLQVSYYETQSGKLKYSQNSKELKLYNLPFNNPRIYYKNGFLLLDNGGKTYDINAKGIELDLNEIVP